MKQDTYYLTVISTRGMDNDKEIEKLIKEHKGDQDGAGTDLITGKRDLGIVFKYILDMKEFLIMAEENKLIKKNKSTFYIENETLGERSNNIPVRFLDY